MQEEGLRAFLPRAAPGKTLGMEVRELFKELGELTSGWSVDKER